jgi:hypothetical protein
MKPAMPPTLAATTLLPLPSRRHSFSLPLSLSSPSPYPFLYPEPHPTWPRSPCRRAPDVTAPGTPPRRPASASARQPTAGMTALVLLLLPPPADGGDGSSSLSAPAWCCEELAAAAAAAAGQYSSDSCVALWPAWKVTEVGYSAHLCFSHALFFFFPWNKEAEICTLRIRNRNTTSCSLKATWLVWSLFI